MSILTYFHPVKRKPDLPDPSGPLKEKVPPATIAAANAKVVEATDQRINIEQTAKNSRGTWLTVTSVTSPLGFRSITATVDVSLVSRSQTFFLAQVVVGTYTASDNALR